MASQNIHLSNKKSYKNLQSTIFNLKFSRRKFSYSVGREHQKEDNIQWSFEVALNQQQITARTISSNRV